MVHKRIDHERLARRLDRLDARLTEGVNVLSERQKRDAALSQAEDRSKDGLRETYPALRGRR